MKVKTEYFKKGINLPYVIEVENPKAKIGIFGDSFAALSEFTIHDPINFCHESSWVFYLANILDMECHTYGVCMSGMSDIFYTLEKCETVYDYYIIFHTNPVRKGLFSNVKYNLSTCKIMKKILSDKKVLSIYWNAGHIIFDFQKPYLVCNRHLTNPNIPREHGFNTPQNNLDKQGSFHHMSNRGNLLFALDVSKLFIANYLKN